MHCSRKCGKLLTFDVGQIYKIRIGRCHIGGVSVGILTHTFSFFVFFFFIEISFPTVGGNRLVKTFSSHLCKD